MAFVRQLGADQADVVVKTDDEAAVTSVIDAVAGPKPTAKTIREEAPRGSSATRSMV